MQEQQQMSYLLQQLQDESYRLQKNQNHPDGRNQRLNGEKKKRTKLRGIWVTLTRITRELR
ncbi:unnamed protein product [Acanthoscelides obtectus]|uniref:Uncharacterized protein n=1 Tax=Acanthoscelides obtectus TaxID=200917 RepID=A0A9P0LUZ8_ACAOB|nr:unnamed protein product [Acanthoscelides obtectus]CAK1668523.1 hypothetical protein AOBTE_LOCUS26458 [Acanthoscelides obtectus]